MKQGGRGQARLGREQGRPEGSLELHPSLAETSAELPKSVGQALLLSHAAFLPPQIHQGPEATRTCQFSLVQ